MSTTDPDLNDAADFIAIEGFDSEIESVLATPIRSQEAAESFLLRWMYDGFAYPLEPELFEIRTVLEPEKFDELLTRVSELYDLAATGELERWDDDQPAELVVGDLFAKVEGQWLETQREDDAFDISAYDDEL